MSLFFKSAFCVFLKLFYGVKKCFRNLQKGETHNFVDLDLFVYLVEMEQQTNVAIFPNGERKIL